MTTPLEQCRAFDKTHGKALVIKLGRVSQEYLDANEAAQVALHALVDELAFYFVDSAPMWKQERMAPLDGARLDFTRASLDVVDAWALKVASQTTSKLRQDDVFPTLSAYFTKTLFLNIPGLCWTGGATFASRGVSSGSGAFRYFPTALVELLFDSGIPLGPTMDLIQSRTAADVALRAMRVPEKAEWPCSHWAR